MNFKKTYEAITLPFLFSAGLISLSSHVIAMEENQNIENEQIHENRPPEKVQDLRSILNEIVDELKEVLGTDRGSSDNILKATRLKLSSLNALYCPDQPHLRNVSKEEWDLVSLFPSENDLYNFMIHACVSFEKKHPLLNSQKENQKLLIINLLKSESNTKLKQDFLTELNNANIKHQGLSLKQQELLNTLLKNCASTKALLQAFEKIAEFDKNITYKKILSFYNQLNLLEEGNDDALQIFLKEKSPEIENYIKTRNLWPNTTLSKDSYKTELRRLILQTLEKVNQEQLEFSESDLRHLIILRNAVMEPFGLFDNVTLMYTAGILSPYKNLGLWKGGYDFYGMNMDQNIQQSILNKLDTAIKILQDQFGEINDLNGKEKFNLLTPKHEEFLIKNGQQIFENLIHNKNSLESVLTHMKEENHSILASHLDQYSIKNNAWSLGTSFFNQAKKLIIKKKIETKDRQLLTEAVISLMWYISSLNEEPFNRGSFSVMDPDDHVYHFLLDYLCAARDRGETRDDLEKKNYLTWDNALDPTTNFGGPRLSSHYNGKRVPFPNGCQFGINAVFESTSFPVPLFPGHGKKTLLFGKVKTGMGQEKLFLKFEENDVSTGFGLAHHMMGYAHSLKSSGVDKNDRREKDLPVDVVSWVKNTLLNKIYESGYGFVEDEGKQLWVQKFDKNETLDPIIQKIILNQQKFQNLWNKPGNSLSKIADVSELQALAGYFKLLDESEAPRILKKEESPYITGNEVFLNLTPLEIKREN